jgi:guanine deaminase
MNSTRTITLFRAGLLNPIDSDTWVYIRDGIYAVSDGRIIQCGPTNKIYRQFPNIEVISLDGTIMPGFTDLHCHWVQHDVQGVYSGELLDWLQNYIWPEERRFINESLARERAKAFYSDMLRAGTVMGLSFSSVHVGATKIALSEMRGDWIIGNALMAVNAPNYLTSHSCHRYDDLRSVVDDVDGSHYAVTPRFAPNLRAVDLRIAAEIASSRSLLLQTHLAESKAEVRWVKELFPEAKNYTDVYDRIGLLGSRTVLAHCVELDETEWICLAKRRAWVAHCPSSNEALYNSRMPLERLRQFHVSWALASDIGAGPSHSMLHVLQRFFAIHEAAGVRVTSEEGLYRSTLAGAQAIGRDKVAGNFMPGKRADFVLMPGRPRQNELSGWFRDLCVGTIAELEHRPLGTWLGGMQIEP